MSKQKKGCISELLLKREICHNDYINITTGLQELHITAYFLFNSSLFALLVSPVNEPTV